MGRIRSINGEGLQPTSIAFCGARAMGIRDRPISPGLPWQNGHVERLIGTLRRECLDRVLIFGEAHLRRILFAYAASLVAWSVAQGKRPVSRSFSVGWGIRRMKCRTRELAHAC
jgi:transposase InsO family protein